MTATHSSPPTRKQLAYLRQLAQRAGQTFTYPQTSVQASREIRRLKAIASTGFSFAELQAERHDRQANDDAPPYAPAFRDSEIRGYGSSATWSQRS